MPQEYCNIENLHEICQNSNKSSSFYIEGGWMGEIKMIILFSTTGIEMRTIFSLVESLRLIGYKFRNNNR